MNVIRRNGTYYLRRRVPQRYAEVETRQTVWISLHTDSETVARQKAATAWSHLIEGWEARVHGDDADAERRFEAVRELAAIRGFRYISADEVARLPESDFIARVRAAVDRDGQANPREAAAVLGGVKAPGITIEKALELYWSLAHDRTIGKSEDQVRRWQNPRKKAVANFVRVVGNKAIEDITTEDMLDFREWWMERMKAVGLTPNSANKDFTHLGDILKTVNSMKRLGLDLPLAQLSFKQGEKGTRPPFSVDWIKDKLLAPGALDGLNLQARCILLGMINTGYRPSEGAALLPDQIRLETDIPHISIEATGRQLKSQYARRTIPLTGVSLEAFRSCPEGFPAYRNKDTLSATVNKYLRENGLLETPDHTMYGLRHTFEDRLLAASVDERIRRDLFGHTLNRERYGAGASLKHKWEILCPIAI